MAPVTETETPDSRLVADSLAGDDEAFARIVGRHKDRVIGLARRFSADPHTLDDIAQETFVTAYRKLAHWRGDAPFEHWLMRIATRKCLDHARRVKRTKSEVPLDDLEYALRCERSGAELRAADARSVLAWLMADLPPEDRMVLTLLDLEGESVEEIAGRLGWGMSKVKVRAMRTRQKLAKRLEEEAHRHE